MIPSSQVRHPRSSSSCDRYRNPTCAARWTRFRHCRSHAASSPTADSQSRPKTWAQPSDFRSDHRHGLETLNSAAFPSQVIERRYHLLFSSHERRPPGPKGPSKELIDAVVAMKRRNPSWGCPPHCPADNRSRFRRRYRQRRRPPNSGHPLPPQSGSGPS